MNYFNAVWGRWFVIGVASSGDSSVNCLASTRPDIYARVRGYLDWIGGATGLKPIGTTTTTTTTTQNPNLFSCAGKPNGNYPNPASACSKTFYMCSNEEAYLFVSDCQYVPYQQI